MILGLLESTVPTHIATISQRVLVAMMIAKLKWMLIAFATISLALLVAGSGMLALAGPGKEVARTQIERVRSAPPQARRDLAIADEELADKQESMKVEAELLELQTDTMKA